jgi:hypothetical protein
MHTSRGNTGVRTTDHLAGRVDVGDFNEAPQVGEDIDAGQAAVVEGFEQRTVRW